MGHDGTTDLLASGTSPGLTIGGMLERRGRAVQRARDAFFGTLKYEHLYRATIGDGNALAVKVNLFRHTCNTLPPTRPSTNAHHARLTSPSNTAISD